MLSLYINGEFLFNKETVLGELSLVIFQELIILIKIIHDYQMLCTEFLYKTESFSLGLKEK